MKRIHQSLLMLPLLGAATLVSSPITLGASLSKSTDIAVTKTVFQQNEKGQQQLLATVKNQGSAASNSFSVGVSQSSYKGLQTALGNEWIASLEAGAEQAITFTLPIGTDLTSIRVIADVYQETFDGQRQNNQVAFDWCVSPIQPLIELMCDETLKATSGIRNLSLNAALFNTLLDPVQLANPAQWLKQFAAVLEKLREIQNVEEYISADVHQLNAGVELVKGNFAQTRYTFVGEEAVYLDAMQAYLEHTRTPTELNSDIDAIDPFGNLDLLEDTDTVRNSSGIDIEFGGSLSRFHQDIADPMSNENVGSINPQSGLSMISSCKDEECGPAENDVTISHKKDGSSVHTIIQTQKGKETGNTYLLVVEHTTPKGGSTQNTKTMRCTIPNGQTSGTCANGYRPAPDDAGTYEPPPPASAMDVYRDGCGMDEDNCEEREVLPAMVDINDFRGCDPSMDNCDEDALQAGATADAIDLLVGCLMTGGCVNREYDSGNNTPGGGVEEGVDDPEGSFERVEGVEEPLDADIPRIGA